jgi:uncharacterized protein YggU (UPF0235/DUF167 family)
MHPNTGKLYIVVLNTITLTLYLQPNTGKLYIVVLNTITLTLYLKPNTGKLYIVVLNTIALTLYLQPTTEKGKSKCNIIFQSTEYIQLTHIRLKVKG